MTIKIRNRTGQPLQQHGNWIDLYTNEDIALKSVLNNPTENIKDNKLMFHRSFALIDLGISIQLPKHYEMQIVPRSSTFKKYGIIQTNSIGIIDDTYCGEGDIIKFPALAIYDTQIPKHTRICQFTIKPSMDAPILTKLKWLFTNKITFKEVDVFTNENRGGFGSTDN